MTENQKARLAAIDDLLGPDETVLFDVLALLLDPGGGLKKREAEGHLVLTDCRVIFATPRHGILVDLPRREINTPVTVKRKYLMDHLKIETKTGTAHSLVLKRAAAEGISRSINEATRGGLGG